jgi:hypothetical protein
LKRTVRNNSWKNSTGNFQLLLQNKHFFVSLPLAARNTLFLGAGIFIARSRITRPLRTIVCNLYKISYCYFGVPAAKIGEDLKIN